MIIPANLPQTGFYTYLRRRADDDKVFFSANFHLQVIRKLDVVTRGVSVTPPADSGLWTRHRARPLDMATNVADQICSRFPSLSGPAQQVIFAKIVNPIGGDDVIPLSRLESKTYSASEVGKILGISANNVGRLANAHGLKCAEYGIVILDKSRSSEKRVETFRYNEAGLTRFGELVPPKSDQNLH